MSPTGLLFVQTSLVEQYSYEKEFGGVFDALRQSFLVNIIVGPSFRLRSNPWSRNKRDGMSNIS